MLSTQSEGTPLTHAEPAHHLVRLLGWCGHAVRNSIQPPMTRSGTYRLQVYARFDNSVTQFLRQRNQVLLCVQLWTLILRSLMNTNGISLDRFANMAGPARMLRLTKKGRGSPTPLVFGSSSTFQS